MNAAGHPSPYAEVRSQLAHPPRSWLVTGAAGFIGSHLLDCLLRLDQRVVGLDNFSTGLRSNLAEVTSSLNGEQRNNFRLIEGDIRDRRACRAATEGVEIVLHQAALGSVPRSIEDPATTHEVNVDGFVNVLLAARDADARRVVYASSSSVYGDAAELPKREDAIGRPLSPYAATKQINEVYADTFARSYGMELIGLRYFNVFGPRQDPTGPYAAVVPLWFDALMNDKPAYINGDGETSRDFCFVANAVQANLLAAMSTKAAVGKIYNVATGQRTTLNRLFAAIRDEVARALPSAAGREPVRRDFRAGDVRHSLADIAQARNLLGYAPRYNLAEGLRETAQWYLKMPATSPTVR